MSDLPVGPNWRGSFHVIASEAKQSMAQQRERRDEAIHTEFIVMAGLVPAIHVFLSRGSEDVDARHKAGHDDNTSTPSVRDAPSGAGLRAPRNDGGWGDGNVHRPSN